MGTTAVDSLGEVATGDPKSETAARFEWLAGEVYHLIHKYQDDAAYAALADFRRQVLEEAARVAEEAGPAFYAHHHKGLTRGPSEQEAFIASAIRSIATNSAPG